MAISPHRAEPDLAGLFPPGVASGAARVRPGVAASFRVEADAVNQAVPARRDEFLTGRELARGLVAAHGSEAGPIPVGPRRAPIWPQGVVGSIAHAGAMCVAAAARQGDFTALGIDLEPDEALEPALEAAICTPQEIDELHRTLGGRCASPVRAAFSAKEAVFKALFPITAEELEFTQVSILWSPAAPTFRPTFHNAPAHTTRLGAAIRGALRVTHGWIVAAAWLEAEGR